VASNEFYIDSMEDDAPWGLNML